MKFSIYLLIIISTVFTAFSCGDNGDKNQSDKPVEDQYSSGKVMTRSVSGLGVDMAETQTFKPNITTYQLPIANLEAVTNLQRDIIEKAEINLSEAAKEKLLTNGFVVIPSDETRFSQVYESFKSDDPLNEENVIPTYVTADSVMHLYHIYFEQILKFIEVRFFIPDLQAMTKSMLDYTKRYKVSFEDEKMQQAIELQLGYLSVIAKILDPDMKIDSGVKEKVENELAMMEKHEKILPSSIFSTNCPLISKYGEVNMCAGFPQAEEWKNLKSDEECYCEDFTQYVPRGHYTQTEELKKFFKAMMYMGRMTFLMKNDRPTVSALMLVNTLKAAELEDGRKALDVWDRIYRVTSFFAGNSDDLLPDEYDSAFRSIFGETGKITSLTDSTNVEKFVEKINELRDPGILGGFKNALLETREEMKGMRLMGQRFAPDSYVLGNVVGDNAGIWADHEKRDEIMVEAEKIAVPEEVGSCVGVSEKDPLEFGNVEMYCSCRAANTLGFYDFCRQLPSGLDVMTAMGSRAAEKIQKERDYKYVLLEKTHKTVKKEFSEYTKRDYSQNTYWGWLYMLHPLIKDYGEGWPTYMQTDAWKDFTLNSALASWSELRHDTILYVKQSYTEAYGIETSAPQDPKYYGYVEPIPEFYKRVSNLTEMMIKGLKNLELADEKMIKALENGKSLMDRLYSITEKELTGVELTEADVDYIKDIGVFFNSLIKELAKAVTEKGKCEYSECEEVNTLEYEKENDPFDVRLIADVHTAPDIEKVLEAGTGNVDYIIVVRRMNDGTLGASIGPVFSYREFPHQMKDRLTDEKWRGEILGADSSKGVPEWSDSFRVDE